MAVVIREIVTEVALAPDRNDSRTGTAAAGASGSLSEEEAERVVRRCTERVLEVLRREWDQ